MDDLSNSAKKYKAERILNDRRKELDRRKARKKLFANAKTPQPIRPLRRARYINRCLERESMKLSGDRRKPPFRLKARNAL